MPQDAIIIGGGMLGLSCALALHRRGLKVTVVEKDVCGGGATGKSSGFITPDSELSLSLMLDHYGIDQARKLWGFVCAGVQRIQQTIDDLALPCDFQAADSVFIANTPGGFKDVLHEHEARRKLGFTSTLYPASSVQEIVGSSNFHGAVRYGQTFSIHAKTYVSELKKVLEAAGVKVLEHTQARRAGKGSVEVPGETLRAEHVVVCTDRWLPKLKLAPAEVYSAQTFLGLTRPLTAAEIDTIFPDGPCLVWDTELVYHYFRLTADHRLMVGGGNLAYTYIPFEVQGKTVRRQLEAYIQEKFPALNLTLERFWPGLLGVTKDFLPMTGSEDGVWFAAGAAGLPWAAQLGEYLADKVTSNRSDFDIDFSPDRPFAVGRSLQKVLTKPVAFAISQGLMKL
jgi:gamma-glutamylputrescine oxidase